NASVETTAPIRKSFPARCASATSGAARTPKAPRNARRSITRPPTPPAAGATAESLGRQTSPRSSRSREFGGGPKGTPMLCESSRSAASFVAALPKRLSPQGISIPSRSVPWTAWSESCKRQSCLADDAGSFDHLIRPLHERRRDRETERLGGLEVDDQLELCW